MLASCLNFGLNSNYTNPIQHFPSTADDPNLKASVMSLAHLLKIPNHEDPLVRLHVSWRLKSSFIKEVHYYIYIYI